MFQVKRGGSVTEREEGQILEASGSFVALRGSFSYSELPELALERKFSGVYVQVERLGNTSEPQISPSSLGLFT